MPVKLKRFPKQSFRWVQYSGTVTMDDLQYVTDTVYGPLRTALPERFSLLDLAQVQSVDIDFNALFGTATRARGATSGFDQPMRVAILLSGEASFGMARMYQSLLQATGAGESAIFDTCDAALHWLDMPEIPIELHSAAWLEA